MYTYFDGHHSGGSSFDMYMMFGFCYKMWGHTHRYKFGLKKKVSVYGLASRTRFGSANRVGPGFGV